jgi:general secretion pathway protein J
MSAVRKNIGFTLLEVMLAMTLLSIMVVLLFSSLKIGAESWNKGESKIAEVNEKAVVYQFFKRHLPSIRPLWDDFSDDERRFSFQGEVDTFQFVSVFPVSAARKGLQLFKIFPDKSEKGVIKVLLTPFYPTLEEQQWEPEEVVLLENVEEFEISYFGKDDSENEGVWVDNWQEKELLPALLKIKIVLKDHSYWPEMIFALKLSAIENNNIQSDTSNFPPEIGR